MLMSLGMFTFALDTAPYQSIRRSTQQRWESKNRVGKGPAYQHLGQGEDSITVEGTLAPQLTGGPKNLDKLREMAASGKAWILTSGANEVLDAWFIDRVEESGSHFLPNGQARKITFSLSLRRYWDDDPATLGKLLDSRP